MFKILIFEWILSAGIKKQIAEIGRGRKNQLRPSNVLTLLNLKVFNSENSIMCSHSSIHGYKVTPITLGNVSWYFTFNKVKLA